MRVPRLLCLFTLFLLGVLHALDSALAQQALTLEPGIRVYDETGSSLTAQQIADIEQRLVNLKVTGPDAIVVVRNQMATPQETLDQVETLQQEWAAANGIDDDLAVAILINRNPDDPNDARAGIYVGSALDDGNVPESEQRAIVDDALIPPLREGDVYTSLVQGITRLESSYVIGPPQSAFDRWAEDASSTWLAPAGAAIAAVLGGIAVWFYRKREVAPMLNLPPTTLRPDALHPAFGGALATGGPQASAIPATLLGLAERSYLAFEQESEGGVLSKATLQIRLHQDPPLSDEIDQVVWHELAIRSEDEIVASKHLQKIAADFKPVKRAIDAHLGGQGWTNPALTSARNWLVWIALIAVVLAIASVFITVVGGNWIGLIAPAALASVAVCAIWQYASFAPFTRTGQSAAAPWRAYRAGLGAALKEQATPLDLNAVLVDAVAMNLGSRAGKRVEAAQDAGVVLNAFSGANIPAAFPVWVAFNSTVASASGSGSSTVSAGGAGGGGGAAGST